MRRHKRKMRETDLFARECLISRVSAVIEIFSFPLCPCFLFLSSESQHTYSTNLCLVIIFCAVGSISIALIIVFVIDIRDQSALEHGVIIVTRISSWYQQRPSTIAARGLPQSSLIKQYHKKDQPSTSWMASFPELGMLLKANIRALMRAG